MKVRCVVCGERADGLITFGEEVCWTCHEEATGERRPPETHAARVSHLHKRIRVGERLIAERLESKLVGEVGR